MKRHRDNPEHLHRFARLRACLSEVRASDAMNLVSRLARCAGPSWGRRFTCRSPSCPACRDRYIADQRRKALRRFRGAGNEELALVSINLGAVFAVDEIGPVMAKARRDLRNMFDRHRRKSAAWLDAELLLWLETDAVLSDDVALLGRDKQAQVFEFATVFEGRAEVIWLPGLHGILRSGPGLDFGQVRTALEAQFPGHNRVDVAPFAKGKALSGNVGDVVNYALKNACATNLHDPATGMVRALPWEDAWSCEYYRWVHRWSRGFHSLRMTIRRKKPRAKRGPDSEVGLSASDANIDVSHGSPMPMTHGFSVFDRDYYY